MATSTFNKNFVLHQKDADHFIDTIKNSNEQVLDSNFKSAIVVEKDIRSLLVKVMGN